jgi:hypothetical protein
MKPCNAIGIDWHLLASARPRDSRTVPKSLAFVGIGLHLFTRRTALSSKEERVRSSKIHKFFLAPLGERTEVRGLRDTRHRKCLLKVHAKHWHRLAFVVIALSTRHFL